MKSINIALEFGVFKLDDDTSLMTPGLLNQYPPLCIWSDFRDPIQSQLSDIRRSITLNLSEFLYERNIRHDTE